MSMTMTEYVGHLVMMRAAAIEKACEEALVLGDRGVLIVEDRPGLDLMVGPHIAVPYGEVYTVPHAGLDAFLARARS